MTRPSRDLPIVPSENELWQSTKDYAFATISPASLKCVFFAFLILQLTTLYSGHMASESLTLQRSR